MGLCLEVKGRSRCLINEDGELFRARNGALVLGLKVDNSYEPCALITGGINFLNYCCVYHSD